MYAGIPTTAANAEMSDTAQRKTSRLTYLGRKKRLSPKMSATYTTNEAFVDPALISLT